MFYNIDIFFITKIFINFNSELKNSLHPKVGHP